MFYILLHNRRKSYEIKSLLIISTSNCIVIFILFESCRKSVCFIFRMQFKGEYSGNVVFDICRLYLLFFSKYTLIVDFTSFGPTNYSPLAVHIDKIKKSSNLLHKIDILFSVVPFLKRYGALKRNFQKK